jgi:electron transfer flavoprotein alpha subunit
LGTAMNRDVWVLLECERKKMKASSMALIEEARQLVNEWDGSLTAVYLGEPIKGLATEIGACGVDCLLWQGQQMHPEHSTEFNAELLSQLVLERQPRLVLTAATAFGSDLMARVSAKTATPLVTNCLEVKVGEDFKFIKPIQNGRLHATFRCRSSSTQMATLIPDTLIDPLKEPLESQCRTEDIELVDSAVREDFCIRMTGFQKADHRTIDIGEAETIVAVGKGLGTVENMEKIEAFADQIGAAIGGTRPMVDAKILPYERQIGQTGKRVAPKLIFLCGISGAIEFVKGIEKAGTKLAINNDRDAPIFRSIDVGIVGDLNAVLPRIIAHVKQVKERASNDGSYP